MGDEVLRIDGGPTVVKSALGWLLSGPTMTSDPAVSGIHLAVRKQSMSPEHLSYSNTEILRSFWEREAVGIKESSNLESNLEIFLSNVKFYKGRYEVGLSWLREKDEVPQYYNLCLSTCKGY